MCVMKGKMIKDGSINIATKLDKDNFTTDTNDDKSLVNVVGAKQIVSSEFTNTIEPNHTTDMGNPRSFVDVETLNNSNFLSALHSGKVQISIPLQNGVFTIEDTTNITGLQIQNNKLLLITPVISHSVDVSVDKIDYLYVKNEPSLTSIPFIKYKLTFSNPNNISGNITLLIQYIHFNV